MDDVERLDGGAIAARQDLARLVQRLSYLSFLPFVVLVVWLASISADHLWHEGTVTVLTAYAALVLTFLAGVRLGFSMAGREEVSGREVLLALVPVLAAWVALILVPRYALGLLAIAFAAQGALDAFGVHAGTLPEWYGKLRMRMTFLKVAAMIAALIAIG